MQKIFTRGENRYQFWLSFYFDIEFFQNVEISSVMAAWET